MKKKEKKGRYTIKKKGKFSKRQKKDTKYGPGPKRDKKNTSESSAQMKGFNPWKNKTVDQDIMKGKGGSKFKVSKKRPGKQRRHQQSKK